VRYRYVATRRRRLPRQVTVCVCSGVVRLKSRQTDQLMISPIFVKIVSP
jgi:hypothetical protein